MKGGITMGRKTIIVLLIVIGLIMGGMFSSQKAYAVSYAHTCVVPYCIKTGNWATGLHIVGLNYLSETFIINFVSENGCYKTVSLDLADYPGGWTGTVQQLCAMSAPVILNPEVTAPVSPFESPSMLIIYSFADAFTVTQFLDNGIGGFGFQTFYSYPSGSWPNPTTLSESQGAGGMSSYSDAIPPVE
ncbi:MAG: hypothetical protein U9N38_03650 [Thermodesulfobacteriota bacterium]|nr:hypothetical protein [Thermodesulfobacteriota bacterium]